MSVQLSLMLHGHRSGLLLRWSIQCQPDALSFGHETRHVDGRAGLTRRYEPRHVDGRAGLACGHEPRAKATRAWAAARGTAKVSR